MTRILQGWVDELGLRHQGVLLTAVRGCDTVPKGDISKKLIRAFRCEILVPFGGDPRKAASFIEHFEVEELADIMNEFCFSLDHYPLHFVLHMAHAAEIIGYHHPGMEEASVWLHLYKLICKKFHMKPESREELDRRLTKDEKAFGADQHDSSTQGEMA